MNSIIQNQLRNTVESIREKVERAQRVIRFCRNNESNNEMREICTSAHSELSEEMGNLEIIGSAYMLLLELMKHEETEREKIDHEIKEHQLIHEMSITTTRINTAIEILYSKL